MYNTRPVGVSRRVARILFAFFLLSLVVLLSACGGDPQVQHQTSQQKAQLDQLLQHARQIGVPAPALNPLQKQEQQIATTGAPFSPFNDQPVTDYYRNQASQYLKLQGQLQVLITSTTNQYQLQAQNDVQVFQQALARRSQQHLGNLQRFTVVYNTDQSLLTTAVYPKDYTTISQSAQQATLALGLMGLISGRLSAFNTTISQMLLAHLDVTAMQMQYQSDLQTFNSVTTPQDFQKLGTLLDAQYQQAVVNSIAALPYVSAAKLTEFKTQLTLLKTYGLDPAPYQVLYNADQAAIAKAKTIADFLAFSRRIDADMASMHNNLVQGAANYLIGEIDREANAWGQAHIYHDKFDGNNY